MIKLWIKRIARSTKEYLLQPWSSIRRFGESRLLRSSFVWIGIVPVAAMAFNKVDQIRLPFLGETFHVNLALPFSWIAFYLAACSFSLGGVIYSILCPAIIRDYRNYTEFIAEGRNPEYLFNAFIHALAYRDHDELQSYNGKKFEDMLEMDYDDLLAIRFNYLFLETEKDNTTEDESNPYLDILEGNSLKRLARGLLTNPIVFKPEKIRDAFWHVRTLSDTTFEKSRLTCVLSYSIGFALIFVVLLQNFWFVVSLWLFR